MFLSDSEIRERLNIPEKRWRPAVQHFERQGFPRVDPLIGKRYWPAVETWLLQRYAGGPLPRTPVPLEVKNMDSRAGGITEATDAGASIEAVRHHATHRDARTTMRYSRQTLAKTQSVAEIRNAVRKPKEEK